MKISEENYIDDNGIKHKKTVYGIDPDTITSTVDIVDEVNLTEEYTDELLDD